MTVTAVVFDFDYTLTVPDRPRQEVLDDATEAVGAPRIDRATYLDVHADYLDVESRTPIFADILDAADSDADPAALAEAYREALGDALAPVEGVPGLLADLRERYRLGLLTNGSTRAQRSKLEAFEWVDAFDATVVTGELDAGKPDERAFAAILDELGVAPERAVYVGDDPEADVHGAQAAGMAAIQVVFDGGPDPAPAADAHVERDRLAAELPGLLESL
ncbi:HAD family hydrolase [Halorussus marinus]|uniref:HAD family hydrolase n=1 Tax=Halorussus marinus TaxID=2505976 RepID=UPI00106EA059|nr:HAD family hydrolase [Halorussus marinus]